MTNDQIPMTNEIERTNLFGHWDLVIGDFFLSVISVANKLSKELCGEA
jgi:hypothetical protein